MNETQLREALLRMLDANFNRAREAARVLEDVARFGLDDGGLSARLKMLRHGLREALERVGAADVLEERAVERDVGRVIEGPREYERAGLLGLVRANSARLSEALRSLEEASKGLGAADAAAGFERLRYESYELEQLLAARVGENARVQWRLCVLITEALCRGGAWERVAAEAVRGGADCLQLREKDLPDRELVERGARLVSIARGGEPDGRRAAVIINDRVDVALACGADGVHLGQEDMNVRDARRAAGARLVIGVSTENVEQARAAVAAGADYCGVGPMFATTTKHKPRLAGPTYLRAYMADEVVGGVPHLAIGGIHAGNVGELREAGCRGVAVSSAVCGAEDVAGACAAIVRGLGAAGG